MMSISTLFLILCITTTGSGEKKKRKCKLTFEQFRNSHDWNRYYNKSRKFYFDDVNAGLKELKLEDYDMGRKTRASKNTDYEFPYRLSSPTYTLLKPKGFRISIKDPGFVKWIQVNMKFEETFNMPYDYCVPAQLIGHLELKNGSWVYDNTEWVHYDFGCIYFWFLVSTHTDLVYRVLQPHFLELIEYNDGEIGAHVRITTSSYYNPGESAFDVPTFRRRVIKYSIPIPKFKFLKPFGFSVTLPPNPLIDLFGFYAKVNEPFQKKQNKTEFNAYIIGVVEEPSYHGEWKYINKDYRLFNGDVIYFWIGVLTTDRMEHIKHQMCFNVSEKIDGLTAKYCEVPNVTYCHEFVE